MNVCGDEPTPQLYALAKQIGCIFVAILLPDSPPSSYCVCETMWLKHSDPTLTLPERPQIRLGTLLEILLDHTMPLNGPALNADPAILMALVGA